MQRKTIHIGIRVIIVLFVVSLVVNITATNPTTNVQDPHVPLASAGSTGFLKKFGTITITNPYGIALNGSGYVYATDNNRILVISPSGQYINSWGTQGTGNGQFNDVRGIAVNSSGHVYVADSANRRIQVFSQTGQYLYEFGVSGSGDGEFNFPIGIAINGSGFVYVADTANHRFQIFNVTGQFIAKIGASGGSGVSGNGDGEFNGPQGIAINGTGYVYIADSVNHRVQLFSQTGLFISKWNKSTGGNGNGDGEFYFPRGIAINNSGAVYVSDSGNNRVQVFTQAGQFLTKWGSVGSINGQFINPVGIGVNSTLDLVYVAETNNRRVQIFSSTGQFQAKLVSLQPGTFNSLEGVAINATGYIYVADSRNNRVQVLTPTGQFLTMWGKNGGDGTSGFGNGEFNYPTGIAVNSSGHIFVVEANNHRVQVFTQTGQYVSAIGDFGSDDGKFNSPFGIAINGSGFIYVADTFNNRIQVFNPDNTFVGKWNRTDGGSGSGNGEFSGPKGIAVNTSGGIYVMDTLNNRVQVFTPSGQYLNQWGSAGSGDGDFVAPNGIAINSSGNVYVIDTYNHRLQIFTVTGQFITKIGGTTGTGDGQFAFPSGIAISTTQHVFIADTSNHRIQVIGNTLPDASSAAIGPTTPRTTDDLILGNFFNDLDGDQMGAAEIRWYKNGILQSQFNDAISISASWINKTEKWHATVRPNDTWEYGIMQTTTNVTIANSLPVISNLVIIPATTQNGESLAISYSFSDPDGDVAQAPLIVWYLNGVHQTNYDNLATLPAGAVKPGDTWSVVIQGFDGTDYGIAQTSQSVSIPTDYLWLLLIVITIPLLVVIIAFMRYKKRKAQQKPKSTT